MKNTARQKGAAAVLLAILLPILVGILGLVIDVGHLHAMRRRAQTAADATAVAAAHELRKRNTAGYKQVALKDAALNGFTPDKTTTVEISNPPTSGSTIGNANFVEVVVRRKAPVMFMRALGSESVTIEARAVAGLVDRDVCVLVTDGKDAQAFKVDGNARIEHTGCALHVNSNHATAAVTSGIGTVSAGGVSVVGNVSGSGFSPVAETEAAAVDDPLSDLKAPEFAGCTHTGLLKVKDTQTLYPGVYCGGIEVGANSHAVVKPGVYVLRGGGLTVGGSCGQDGSSDEADDGKSGGSGKSDKSGSSGGGRCDTSGHDRFSVAARDSSECGAVHSTLLAWLQPTLIEALGHTLGPREAWAGKGSSGASSKSSGKSGKSGDSSKSGKSGDSGKSGKSGDSGKSGKSGDSGKSGKSGDSGKSGKSGDSGKSGKSGDSGKSGKSGDSGKSGKSGDSGKSGGSGGGDKDVCAPATLEGDEVMFFNTEGGGYDHGPITFKGNAVVRLTPAETGTYAGVLFLQDRSVTPSKENQFSGNAEVELTGVAYFEPGEFHVTGTSQVTWHTINIITRTMTVSGDASLVEVDRSEGKLAPVILSTALRE